MDKSLQITLACAKDEALAVKQPRKTFKDWFGFVPEMVIDDALLQREGFSGSGLSLGKPGRLSGAQQSCAAGETGYYINQLPAKNHSPR
jgi:hypothetical protein